MLALYGKTLSEDAKAAETTFLGCIIVCIAWELWSILKGNS